MKILFLTSNQDNPLATWLRNQGEEVHVATDVITQPDVHKVNPEIVISYNYPYLLKDPILSLLPRPPINCHISYLPWNRGADPNPWSILESTPSGVSIHHIDQGIDTGDIIAQKKVPFSESLTLKQSYLLLQEELIHLFQENWKEIKLNKYTLIQSSEIGSFHQKRDRFIFESSLGNLGWDISIADFKRAYQEETSRSFLWNQERFPKLCIGTAQFGMPYGIANQLGQPQQESIQAMVQTAFSNGIRFFDTAQAYGDSEKRLGEAFSSLKINESVKVITKLHPNLEMASTPDIINAIKESMNRLGVKKLFSVMLHREDWLHDIEKFSLLAKEISKNQLSESLGVSVYSLKGYELALASPFIKTIQMPYNLLDQRSRIMRCCERAYSAGKLLFLRSIFLQGLLQLDGQQLPSHLQFAKTSLEKYSSFCNLNNLSTHEAPLIFAAQTSPNACLVIGIESNEQLENNIRILKDQSPIEDKTMTHLHALDESSNDALINPSLWKATV